MSPNTYYGTWNNHVDKTNTTVEATVSDAFLPEGPKGYDFEAIVSEYRNAINNALPGRVGLCGDEFIGPYTPDDDEFDGYPKGEFGALDITAIVESVDLWEIIPKHDLTDADPVPVCWSVVRGESPTARAVEPGSVGVTVPDEVLAWGKKLGLNAKGSDVYLLVTPKDEAGTVDGEIAFIEGTIPPEEARELREAVEAL